MSANRKHWFTMGLFLVYMLLLTGVIIFKLPFYSPKLSDGVRVLSLIPWKGSFDENGNLLLREIVQNILIFVPLGIYIAMLNSGWPLKKKIIPIFCLTLAFEAIQFLFAIGRSDITDVIGNTLGGILGIGIYAILQRVLKEKTAAVVNILAFAVTICVVARFSQLFYLSHFVMRRLPPV